MHGNTATILTSILSLLLFSLLLLQTDCVSVCVLCEGICECVYMCMMGVATAWFHQACSQMHVPKVSMKIWV